MIWSSVFGGKPREECEAQGEMVETAGIIGENLRRLKGASADPRKEEIVRIERFVRERIAQANLSAKLVAAEFGYSVSGLCHLFKSKTGMAFGDYVISLRIENSKRLLSGSDLTVAEVGMRVGYTDCASFTRMFKRVTGQTPGAFRVCASEASA